MPLFSSERIGWSTSFAEHQNGDRKMTWQTGVPVIPEERPSPFVAVASIADAASMVTNWGSNGVEQINTDITLTLARLPASLEIGLAAVDRVSSDGIAVGTAAVFDRQGPLGTALVSSIANAKRDRGLRRTRLQQRPPSVRRLNPPQRHTNWSLGAAISYDVPRNVIRTGRRGSHFV